MYDKNCYKESAIRANSLRKLFAKYGVKKANYNGWYCLNFKEVEFSFKDVYIGFVSQAFLSKCDENGSILKIYDSYQDFKKDIELIIKNKAMFLTQLFRKE